MTDLTDRQLQSIKNRATKDRQKRAKLKKRLRAEGASEELIERIIGQRRHEDLIARHGEDEARRIRRESAPTDLGDSGYEPTTGDPLLRGNARATGITAKVVKRKNTITRWQYRRMLEGER